MSAQNPPRLLVLPYGSPPDLGGASTQRRHWGPSIEKIQWPGGDAEKEITWNTYSATASQLSYSSS